MAMTSGDPNLTFGFVLHEAARLMRKRFDQRARNLGLTRAQYQALAYLARNEGIHQNGLADLLEVEPITLGRLIDRMEQAGWVERRMHPTDRRARLLFLTGKAKPVFAEMRALGDATRAEALAGIAPQDADRLFELLLQVRRNLSTREFAEADPPASTSPEMELAK
jgi:DNA-binding MarR family transcriptional regulator